MIRRTTITILIICGLLLVFLAACGDDEPEPEIEGSSGNNSVNTSESSSGVEPSSDSGFEPAVTAILQELPGAVVYVQGNNLALLPFGDDIEPIQLADEVDSDTVSFSPDKRTVIYQSDGVLYAYGTNDVAPKNLGELRFTRTNAVENWSPDGQWFFHRVAGTIIYNLSGTKSYDLSILRLGNTYRWTNDSQLIIIDDNGRAEENFAYQSVTQFDLESGESETIDVDLEAVNSGETTLDAAMLELSYDFAPLPFSLSDNTPRIQVPMEVHNASSQTCLKWTASDGSLIDENTSIIYESQDTYMLSELRVLSDDEWLFLKWTIDNCGVGNPDVNLIRYQISTNQEEVLAEDVFSDFAPARLDIGRIFGDNGNNHRYTISPDGQFILWIGGGIESGTSSLNLINLLNGSNTVILEVEAEGQTSNFANNQLFKGVYWLH